MKQSSWATDGSFSLSISLSLSLSPSPCDILSSDSLSSSSLQSPSFDCSVTGVGFFLNCLPKAEILLLCDMFRCLAFSGFVLETSLAVNRSLLAIESLLEGKLSKFGSEFLLFRLKLLPSTCLLKFPSFTFGLALLSSTASLSGANLIGFSLGDAIKFSLLSGVKV